MSKFTDWLRELARARVVEPDPETLAAEVAGLVRERLAVEAPPPEPRSSPASRLRSIQTAPSPRGSASRHAHEISLVATLGAPRGPGISTDRPPDAYWPDSPRPGVGGGRDPMPKSTFSPTGAAGWDLESQPPLVGAEHRSSVRLYVISPRTRSLLTSAGVVAMIGQLTSYLAAGKVAALYARSAGQDIKSIGCQVTRSHVWADILPEDFTSVANGIAGVLQARTVAAARGSTHAGRSPAWSTRASRCRRRCSRRPASRACSWSARRPGTARSGTSASPARRATRP